MIFFGGSRCGDLPLSQLEIKPPFICRRNHPSFLSPFLQGAGHPSQFFFLKLETPPPPPFPPSYRGEGFFFLSSAQTLARLYVDLFRRNGNNRPSRPGRMMWSSCAPFFTLSEWKNFPFSLRPIFSPWIVVGPFFFSFLALHSLYFYSSSFVFFSSSQDGVPFSFFIFFFQVLHVFSGRWSGYAPFPPWVRTNRVNWPPLPLLF